MLLGFRFNGEIREGIGKKIKYNIFFYIQIVGMNIRIYVIRKYKRDIIGDKIVNYQELRRKDREGSVRVNKRYVVIRICIYDIIMTKFLFCILFEELIQKVTFELNCVEKMWYR